MLSAANARQILQNLPFERLAIAFSGGGDSTALVHLCRALSPKPLILIVDHQLRNGSGVEANGAKFIAEGLGLEARVLKWAHDGVSSAIQEKARHARYALMGQACRDAGIQFLVTGHTRDDQAETLFMRYEKNTGWRGAAGMAERIYAPLWPELAEVTLLRPLLEVTRKDLRNYNSRYQLKWTEDPSNENRSFERIRARDYLNTRPRLGDDLIDTAHDLQMGLAIEKQYLSKHSNIEVDEYGLVLVSSLVPPRLAELVLMVAAGSGRSFIRKKLSGFSEHLKLPSFKSATIANAMCVKTENGLMFGPDPSLYKGRYNRSAILPTKLLAGQQMIWDGRFLISANQEVTIRPAYAVDAEEWPKELKRLPKIFRPAMPVLMSKEQEILAIGPNIGDYGSSVSLVARRLHHMLGEKVIKNLI